MTPEELAAFKEFVTEDKTWINDSYYRLRETSEGYEFAKLEMDACGASTVSPQIKLVLNDNNWQPVSLIDLGTSPTTFIELSEETRQELLQGLNQLMVDCQNSHNKG